MVKTALLGARGRRGHRGAAVPLGDLHGRAAAAPAGPAGRAGAAGRQGGRGRGAARRAGPSGSAGRAPGRRWRPAGGAAAEGPHQDGLPGQCRPGRCRQARCGAGARRLQARCSRPTAWCWRSRRQVAARLAPAGMVSPGAVSPGTVGPGTAGPTAASDGPARRAARPGAVAAPRHLAHRQRACDLRPAGHQAAVRGGRGLAGAVGLRPDRPVGAAAGAVPGCVAVGRRQLCRRPAAALREQFLPALADLSPPRAARRSPISSSPENVARRSGRRRGSGGFDQAPRPRCPGSCWPERGPTPAGRTRWRVPCEAERRGAAQGTDGAGRWLAGDPARAERRPGAGGAGDRAGPGGRGGPS